MYAHAHGYDLSSLFHNPLWRSRYADYRQADGLIVVNLPMKERLLSLGIKEDRIHVVPCGVDVPNQPIRRSPGKVVKCLAVGRMVAKKAPLKLLAAFREASVRVPHLHLDYVGAGRLHAEVLQYVEQFDLSDRVTLHGEQTNEAVLELMTGADIFLQHSIVDPQTGDEEGMPVAILEAMAMALPVLSTRHAGIPEAVDHGVTGLLVEEGDVRGMAAQLVELASAPTLREIMGRRAWARARERFSWTREKTELQKILGLTC
jgi:glycosyltransferase involved in cell wall biosynthesis